MVDFETLCGLPFCAAALDGGTFMHEEFGGTYFCYKTFCAIIVLGCVVARGIFTCVNAVIPGLSVIHMLSARVLCIRRSIVESGLDVLQE